MTTLIVLLFLLVLLLSFILFAPIQIRIDSRVNSYYLDMGRVLRCSLLWQGAPVLQLRFLFFRLRLDPIRWARKRKRKEKTGNKQERSRGKRPSTRRVLALLRSFRCKSFRIGLDTGNVVTNAALFPPAVILNRFTPAQIRINYSGENYAVIEIENRVARMLWAYMSH